MANLDPNTWYDLANGLVGNNGISLQSGFPNPPPIGATFLSPFNSTVNAFRWQIMHPSDDNTVYILRTQEDGPNMYMGTGLNKTCSSGGCETLVHMQPTLDDSCRWTFGPWVDGTYYLYNKANTSSWNFDIQDNGSWTWMNSNISIARAGQHWSISSIAPINDVTYSTVSPSATIITSTIVTTTQATTSTAASLTSTAIPSTSTVTSSISTIASPAQTAPIPTSTQPTGSSTSSTGLSSDAKAAVGASIGGVALILIAIGLFLFLRRRRRRYSPGDGYSPPPDHYAPPFYEKQHVTVESVPGVQTPANHISELPAGFLYPELSGSLPENLPK